MGFSGYYERTFKRTTCQKLAFQGKLAQLCFDVSNTNPSKFDSVHNIRNRIKFRRICVEKSEQNGTRISQDNLPHNASV